jgi:hypothetical protein
MRKMGKRTWQARCESRNASLAVPEHRFGVVATVHDVVNSPRVLDGTLRAIDNALAGVQGRYKRVGGANCQDGESQVGAPWERREPTSIKCVRPRHGSSPGPLNTECPAYSTRKRLLTHFIGRVNDRSLHYH